MYRRRVLWLGKDGLILIKFISLRIAGTVALVLRLRSKSKEEGLRSRQDVNYARSFLPQAFIFGLLRKLYASALETDVRHAIIADSPCHFRVFETSNSLAGATASAGPGASGADRQGCRFQIRQLSTSPSGKA
jgi:hypothetical protein